MPALTLDISDQVLRDLEDLLSTGLYGDSVRAVAEELLRLQLRAELLARRAVRIRKARKQ
jgi:hypothetical protein